MPRIGSDMKILIVILLIIGAWYSSFAWEKQMTWDESAHANAALFAYHLTAYTLENGFSLGGIRDFAADYHAHYKVYNTVASYPPFYYIASVPLIALFGSGIIVAKTLVIIEALIALFFVFRIAGLYGRGRLFPFACVLFLALQPVFIDVATRSLLDMGLIMFTLGGFYFFARFMRFEKHRDLWMAGALLGLSILAKPMFVVTFPLLLVMMAWERKLCLFRRHWAGFAKGLVILIVFASPFVAQQALLSMECTGDACGMEKYVAKWSTMGFSDRMLPSFGEFGEPILAFDSHIRVRDLAMEGREITDFQELTKNLSALLFQFYMIPFFIIGFILAIRRGNETDRYSVLLLLVMLYIFTVIVHAGSLKHISLVIPFATLLSVNGLFAFFGSGRARNFKNLLYPLLALFLALSLFQGIAYINSIGSYITSVDRDEVSRYVIGQAEEPSSVLTTFGSEQTFSFARFDSGRRIYSLYIPRNKADLEKALAGNFSFAGSERWEMEGILYPRPGFVVIHEIRLSQAEFDYGPEYFLNQTGRFMLLKTFNQENPGDRAFVFKVL